METMRKGTILIIAIAGLVTACQTITPEERRERDETECRSYGFKTRNDAFASCMQRLELDRREARREAFRSEPWPTYRGYYVYH